ncbi:hypothetical protein [Streptomyces sp. NPDC001068]
MRNSPHPPHPDQPAGDCQAALDEFLDRLTDVLIPPGNNSAPAPS